MLVRNIAENILKSLYTTLKQNKTWLTEICTDVNWYDSTVVLPMGTMGLQHSKHSLLSCTFCNHIYLLVSYNSINKESMLTKIWIIFVWFCQAKLK
jgi:hypothetical protein